MSRHYVETVSREPGALTAALNARNKIEGQRTLRRGGLVTRDSYLPRHALSRPRPLHADIAAALSARHSIEH